MIHGYKVSGTADRQVEADSGLGSLRTIAPTSCLLDDQLSAMASKEGEEANKCPICPETGPPAPSKEARASQSADAVPTSTTPADNTSPDDVGDEAYDHVWIACTKCNAWYHAACVLLRGGEWEGTVPQEVRDEMREAYPDQGVWFDWAQWVQKW